MLADVRFETDEEIQRKLADYETRFINRFTEKDDGYRICVQKASRHNQVPVIDRRHARRRTWRDRRQFHGRPPFRKQEDHLHRWQEQPERPFSGRNLPYQQQQPLGVLPFSQDQPPFLQDQPPTDYMAEDQPHSLSDGFPSNPLTPGAPETPHGSAPDEREPFEFDQGSYSGRSLNLVQSEYNTTLVESQHEQPKLTPFLEEPHRPTPTIEDCRSILENASHHHWGAVPSKDKAKKRSKKPSEHPKGGDRVPNNAQSLPPPPVISPHMQSSAQILNSLTTASHPSSVEHTHHRMHATPQYASEPYERDEEPSTKPSKKKKKAKKDKKKHKKKEEAISDAAIDVTTMDAAITEGGPYLPMPSSLKITLPHTSQELPPPKRKKNKRSTPPSE